MENCPNEEEIIHVEKIDRMTKTESLDCVVALLMK